MATSRYLALERGDAGASETIRAAREHADAQGATFWATYCALLAACGGRATDFEPRILSVAARDPAYISILAEPISRRLESLSETGLAAVKQEAQRRPVRWREPLRKAMARGSVSARVASARLLDLVGTKDDVRRLRDLAKELRRDGVDQSIGRSLARRLADQVVVEDQGRVVLRVGERAVLGTEMRRKVLSLLCFLLGRPGFAATRDQVLEGLWPEFEPSVALNSLNQTVYFLRRTIEPGYDEDLTPGYVHHDPDVLWLDNELVTSRSAQCRNLIRGFRSEPTPEEVHALSELYRGRFTLDFEYEEWAASYRDTLHASYLEIVERAVDRDTDIGQFDRAIHIARRAVEVDPEAEPVELALLRLYRRTGANAAAAEQYAHYASVIRETLGMEPPPLESL